MNPDKVENVTKCKDKHCKNTGETVSKSPRKRLSTLLMLFQKICTLVERGLNNTANGYFCLLRVCISLQALCVCFRAAV